MTKLGELARLIRSKNAGPFMLTVDVMFDDGKSFERVKASGVLSKELLARMYNTPQADVDFYVIDKALAFKMSIPRPRVQGDILDSDCHGGQQYPPLIDIEIPDQ
jgi:hypothetical protein